MLISFARSDRKLPHTSTKTSDGGDMISGSVGGARPECFARATLRTRSVARTTARRERAERHFYHQRV